MKFKVSSCCILIVVLLCAYEVHSWYTSHYCANVVVPTLCSKE